MPCLSPITLFLPDVQDIYDDYGDYFSERSASLSNPLYNSLTIPRTGLLIDEDDGSCSLSFATWTDEQKDSNEIVLGSPFFRIYKTYLLFKINLLGFGQRMINDEFAQNQKCNLE